MSVNMMAASFRCSAFWESTNALKQRRLGMKPANSSNGLAAFANPAWVGQGGAVRRSATDPMWKTIHNHPKFHQLLAGPQTNRVLTSRPELNRLEICLGPIKVI